MFLLKRTFINVPLHYLRSSTAVSYPLKHHLLWQRLCNWFPPSIVSLKEELIVGDLARLPAWLYRARNPINFIVPHFATNKLLGG
jgi:hypothetical protein